MKAKFYTLIISALLLAGMPAKAQFADNRDYRNDDAGIVINNYYDDYDYYYSSRINRFHRSYAAFDYYSPVFTETYWYNYQPYSWGTSIYGRSALGFGFAVNFPVYYYGLGTDYWYDYNYGWYDPYYGSSWYWGYDPFYYSCYSPVYINVNIGPRWGHNYWHGHSFWHNDYRPVYQTANNYYYNYYSNRNSYRSMPDRNRSGEYNRSTGGSSRRESVPSAAPSRTQPSSNSPSRSQTYSRSQPDRSSAASSSQRSGNTVSQGRSSSGRSENRTSGQSSRSGSSSSSKSSSKSSSGTRSSDSKNSSSRR